MNTKKPDKNLRYVFTQAEIDAFCDGLVSHVRQLQRDIDISSIAKVFLNKDARLHNPTNLHTAAHLLATIPLDGIPSIKLPDDWRKMSATELLLTMSQQEG